MRPLLKYTKKSNPAGTVSYLLEKSTLPLLGLRGGTLQKVSFFAGCSSRVRSPHDVKVLQSLGENKTQPLVSHPLLVISAPIASRHRNSEKIASKSPCFSSGQNAVEIHLAIFCGLPSNHNFCRIERSTLQLVLRFQGGTSRLKDVAAGSRQRLSPNDAKVLQSLGDNKIQPSGESHPPSCITTTPSAVSKTSILNCGQDQNTKNPPRYKPNISKHYYLIRKSEQT